MKAPIFILLLALVGFSCNKKKLTIAEKYLNYTWTHEGEVLFENGKLVYQHEPNEIDSTGVEFVFFSFKIADSLLIFESPEVDTAIYSFTNFQGPKLILSQEVEFSNGKYYPYHIILELKEPKLDSIEELGYMASTMLEIGGFSPGQEIDISTLSHNYGDSYYLNKDGLHLNFEVVEDTYINRIILKALSDFEKDEIIQVIEYKLKCKPEFNQTIRAGVGCASYDTYTWKTLDGDIKIYKCSKVTRADLHRNPRWTLEYSSSIVSELLDYEFENDIPKSKIIK